MLHRRLTYASLVSTVCLFILLGGTSSLAAWKQPIAGALNVDATKSAENPSIANIGGVPYVAWDENNGSGVNQIRVAGLSPSAWRPVGGSLNFDATKYAENPSIAGFGQIGNQEPWVAWTEYDGSAKPQIRVAQYHFGSWKAVGGSLNVDTGQGAYAPRVANVGGVPYVVWQEHAATAYQVRVARFTAGAWSAVGGSLNVDAAQNAANPSVANVGGVPYVVWIETNGNAYQVRVARFTAGAWSAVGGSLNVDATEGAYRPSIENIGGVPYVAWTENDGTTYQVRVARFTAGAWSAVGGSLNVDTTKFTDYPSIANFGGVPYVAWSEAKGSVLQARVKRLTGTAWRPVGGSLNIDAARHASNPSIANIGGVPLVVSQERTVAPPPPLPRAEIRAVSLEPDFLSRRAQPTRTGATLTTHARTYGIPYPIGFDYGTALERQTTTDTAPTGVDSVTVTRTVGGLSPRTSYKFRPLAIAPVPLPPAFGRVGAFSPDVTPPSLTSVRVSPASFAVHPTGAPAVAARFAATQKKKKVARGTRFSFTLSEPARVVFTIERKSSGRRVAGSCVKPTASNKGKPRCTRLTPVGSFAKQSGGGKNKMRFSGKIGTQKLKVARYRATLVATDPAGNRSLARRLSFTVVKP